MSKLIRIGLGTDPNHSLEDFPVNVYTGTTSGDTSNWGFTEEPVLTFPMVTSSPLEFFIEDELLSFGVRLESGGCHPQDLFVESPRVDCDLCVSFIEYEPVDCDMEGDFNEYYQPTPSPSQNPTSTPQSTPNATPSPTQNPTSTPQGTPFPTPEPTPNTTPNPTATPNATPEPTPNPTLEPTLTPSRTPNPTTNTGWFYRIQSCENALDFHAPLQEICLQGNLALTTASFSVGDVVQFIIRSSGCNSATYCGTIIDTNFSAPLDSHTAYISREIPVPSCGDTLHCGQ